MTPSALLTTEENPESVARPLERHERRFDTVVDKLCAASESWLASEHGRWNRHTLPSRSAVEGVVEDLRAVLFPRHFGRSDLAAAALRQHVGLRLDRVQLTLTEQVRAGLAFACEHEPDEGQSRCQACDRRAVEIADSLIAGLPRLRALLEGDAAAAYWGDPAARFLDETLFCYPGFTAIAHHRIAHELQLLAVPLIPRIIADLSRATTGIDIHPAAKIGPSFFIDHGTGVVIGETCVIGESVRIYQGVTLGARGSTEEEQRSLVKGLPRHPIVEDDVIIYAGATILGRITIGRGATIGGNVWLAQSVPPGSQITQAPVRQRAFQGGLGI